MAKTVLLKAAGINTNPNELSTPIEGSLKVAENVIIDRDDIIEARRGFRHYGSSFGTSTDRAKQLLEFNDRLLRHTNTTLAYDNERLLISTLTSTSTTATATTAVAHGLVAGQLVTITGAEYDEYNVVETAISNVTTFAFEYTISNSTVSPATGTIYLESGTFTDYSGSISEPETGRKIHSVELNGNLYMTTSSGIKKLESVTAALKNSGVPRASDLSGEIDYSESAFFDVDQQIGYKVLWGYEDANKNLLLGTPSEGLFLINSGNKALIRDFNNLLVLLDGSAIASDNYAASFTLSSGTSGEDILGTVSPQTGLKGLAAKLDTDGLSVTNYNTVVGTNFTYADLFGYFDAIVDKLNAEPSLTSTTFLNRTSLTAVTLDITIPAGITEDHFFRVYRTFSSGDIAVTPDEEYKLAIEAYPETAELQDGFFTIQDKTPLDFLGAALYTNGSQEGSTQTNDIPPYAKDITVYKNSVFFANTKTRHKFFLDLLSTTGLTNMTSSITIADQKYRFRTSLVEVETVLFTEAEGATVGNYGGKYWTINSANNSHQYYVWYNVGGASIDPAVVDKIGIEVDILAGDAATVIATNTKTALDKLNDFSVSIATATLTITNSVKGPTIDATNGTISEPTTITVTTTQQGRDGERINKYNIVSVSAVSGSEIKVTTATHGLVTGDYVTITNSDCVPNINGERLVTYVSPTEFKISVTNTGVTATAVGTVVVAYALLANEISDSLDVEDSAKSLIRVVNRNPNSSVSGYYESAVDDPPGSMSFESEVLSDTAFSVTGADVVDQFSPDLSNTAELSDNELLPNRLFYSKTQQPDAVPIANYFDVGARDYGIERILALRDSLFVFKRDGIFRITGESVTNLQQSLFDNTVSLQGLESAVTGNNSIYCFTDGGVCSISESGVEQISKNIKNKIKQYHNTSLFSNLDSTCFGIYYETEAKYILWLPTTSQDTVATLAYVFNQETKSWTQYLIEASCGKIKSAEDKLYLGAGDSNYIARERKDFNYRDQAETRLLRSISTVEDNVLTLSSSEDIEVGDILVQSVHLTVARFNRLLSKLDKDPILSGPNDTYPSYYTSLKATSLSDLPSKVAALGVKLDADPVTVLTYPTTVIASPKELQSMFNTIITNLNDPSESSTHDYTYSKNNYKREIAILEVDLAFNRITIPENIDAWDTDCYIEKAIPVNIEWIPQHGGDTYSIKHFSEAQLMFNQYNLRSAFMGFRSDLSQNKEEVELTGEGPAAWGLFSWGNKAWGTSEVSSDFRTYVPRNKQRGRYIEVTLRHANAYEKFAVLGISLKFNINSYRAAR